MAYGSFALAESGRVGGELPFVAEWMGGSYAQEAEFAKLSARSASKDRLGLTVKVVLIS